MAKHPANVSNEDGSQMKKPRLDSKTPNASLSKSVEDVEKSQSVSEPLSAGGESPGTFASVSSLPVEQISVAPIAEKAEASTLAPKPQNTKVVSLPKSTEKGANRSAVQDKTVQSIIKVPTRNLVDNAHVAHYSEVLRGRINKLSTFVNKAASVYSLGNILPTATWGKFRPMNDHNKELCNPATNEPIIVWIVGHVASTWFVKNDVPEKQISITVVPVSEELAVQTSKLLGGLSVPPEVTAAHSMLSVRATRWQNARGESEAPIFQAVFDAREVLKSKSEMEPYLVTDIKKNDLVLVETKVTRYFTRDAENKWAGYRAQFELMAISMLFSSDGQDEEVTNEDRELGDLHI